LIQKDLRLRAIRLQGYQHLLRLRGVLRRRRCCSRQTDRTELGISRNSPERFPPFAWIYGSTPSDSRAQRRREKFPQEFPALDTKLSRPLSEFDRDRTEWGIR
jgi:hypothetical protein